LAEAPPLMGALPRERALFELELNEAEWATGGEVKLIWPGKGEGGSGTNEAA